MKDSSRTKQELIEELSVLKQRLQELEHSESDRKQAEEELLKGEENFRRSLDESPLGVRIVAAEGETIYVNQAALDIYSYDSVEEMKRMPVKERYTPQSYAEYKIRKEKRERGELDPSQYEISIVRKNGEVRHLQAFRKEILWNGVKQAQIIYQDITERRRAEKKLINSEEKFRTLAESSSFAIMMHQGDRWIYANRAAKEISGYTEEDLYSMHFWDFVHPDPETW
jgi:PAS domain S-box-containing protein